MRAGLAGDELLYFSSVSEQASNDYPSIASSLGLAGPTQSPSCIDMWGDTAYSMLPMVLVSVSRLSLTGFVGVGPRSLYLL